MPIRGCRDREHGSQMRGTSGGGQILVCAEVRLAGGADVAVGPGQLSGPFDGVVAVSRLVDQRVVPVTLGSEATAGVLGNQDIAVRDEALGIGAGRILAIGSAHEKMTGNRPGASGR